LFLFRPAIHPAAAIDLAMHPSIVTPFITGDTMTIACAALGCFLFLLTGGFAALCQQLKDE
jgi:hypothetical protein